MLHSDERIRLNCSMVSVTVSVSTAGSTFRLFNVGCSHVLIMAGIIMAGMAVVVAGYLIEERRRWPIITASPRGQCSK